MDKPSDSGVQKLVTGLELVAGALVIGATIASLIDEATSRRKASKSRSSQAADTSHVDDAKALGFDLLTRKHDEGQSLLHFLTQKYHGLWLIGRSGDHIKDTERDALAADLGHLHQQYYQAVGHDTDRALTEWYETVGVGKRLPLAGLLIRSPLVDQTFNAARYAASALTGERDTSLTYDLSQDEWEQIKRHLKVAK